jgi:hypothetical protein
MLDSLGMAVCRIPICNCIAPVGNCGAHGSAISDPDVRVLVRSMAAVRSC